ncbi:MAG: hypothetical protein AseanaTS_30220 [Candidatus Pelagadaptatus aseana]|uniref:substrate-binding periplasmic protein n=1 Tax=Candidatus Pelagadaptatus aseana TaxID=3120508 RepID=UPI0039B1AC82
MTATYPPFLQGDGSGLVEEILDSLFQQMDADTEFQYLPRKRAIHRFKKNPDIYYLGVTQDLIDIPFIAIKIVTYARTVLYYPSEDLNKDNLSLKDMAGKQIAIKRGSSSKNILLSHQINVIEAASLDSLVKLLLSKRVDGIYMPYESYIDHIQPKFGDHTQELQQLNFALNPIYLVAHQSSKNKDLLDRMAEEIKSMEQSGKYQTILQRHYGRHPIPDYMQPDPQLLSSDIIP